MPDTNLEWIVAGAIAAIILGLFRAYWNQGKNRDRMANLCFALLLDEKYYQKKREQIVREIKAHKADDRITLYVVSLIEIGELARRISVKAIINMLWRQKTESADEKDAPALVNQDADESMRNTIGGGPAEQDRELPSQERLVVMAKTLLRVRKGWLKVTKFLKPK